MAVLRASAVVAAAVMALAAVSAAAPTVTTNVLASVLAKGIVKRLSSTGGAVTYVGGSAALLGAALSPNSVNKNQQSGYFTGGASTLVDVTGKGVILTSGPASNLQTGLQVIFSPTSRVPGATDDILTQISIDSNTYTSAEWGNSITLAFDAVLPAGTLSGTYAFCTNRLATSYTASADLATVTLNSTAASYPEANVLLYTGPTLSTDEISVLTRFGTDAGGVPGTSQSLSSNVTRCLNAQTFSTSISTAGTYTIRYTVANQGSVATSGRSQQAYFLAAANVVTTYPDNYNPAIPSSAFTGVDDVNNNNVDTYCIFGSTSALDLVPGFRVEGVGAGPANKLCCAVQGRMNTNTNKCEIKSCGLQVTSFDDFVNAQNSARDCYAQCTKRNAYIGNDPFTNFGSVLQILYDERTDAVTLYTGAPVTTGVSLPDGLYTSGSRTYAYRHGMLVFSDTESTTGISVASAGVTYICQKRGVMSSPTACAIGCDEITADFFAMGPTAGERCFTACYYLA